MKIEIRSFLEPEKEAKLRNALLNAEKCPFHDVLPEIVGPSRKIMDSHAYLKCYERDTWLYEAMLFQDINWTCFCEKCAAVNPTPHKHNRFGYGFCSQYSWQAALRNWNLACMRTYIRLVKDNLKIQEISNENN